MKFSAILLLSSLTSSAFVHADTASPSPWNWALRARVESVDDAALARTALAQTLRLRVSWQRPLPRGFSIFLEGEAVAELNDRFNSGANGQVQFPLVPDARAIEVNQAALRWRNESGGAALGRQRINLDNQRFVGNVGWRQNEQTFDAFSIDGAPHARLQLRYHWLDRAQRINGDSARDRLLRERDLDTHLLNVAWVLPVGTWVSYGYWHNDQDVDAASSRTLGMRYTGTMAAATGQFGWTLEAARQTSWADNPADFSHAYLRIEPTLTLHGITGKLGYERLAGNGQHALQTPLATLHAFNGWADKFASTPADGLQDRYLELSGKWGRGRFADKLSWSLVGHDYQATARSRDYGRELDLAFGADLGKGWNGLLKLAEYRSDGFAADTRKVWVQLEWLH
jgi:hypothetical protein